jgi:L-threonylcarbamoyladenylate synthase
MSKQETIDHAATVVNQGGIIIYPTDTAFGIGCRIDNEETVKKLFSIRKRPLMQATPVLVSSKEMAEEYLEPISAEADTLIVKYWPGVLTIILPCKRDKIPALVRRGNTLGVRMPNHPTALSLIEKVGVPILGPSANFHGEPTPYSFADLDPELVKLVDFVVPGECSVQEASTVVDCSLTPWKVIRQGAVLI